MLNVMLQSPRDMAEHLAQRAKARRLCLNMTQKELAERSGVSLASLRRFETTGEISLASLMCMALVLNELSAFDTLFPASAREDLFTRKEVPLRQRARSKK